MLNINTKDNKGFTLVELLTTTFVFTIIMALAGGIFVQILNLQRRAFAIQDIEENSRFVFESMAREIRFSRITSPGGCASSLDLTHPINGDIVYSLLGEAIHRSVDGQDTVVTDPAVKVTRLNFCATGIGNDLKQQRATITMDMENAKGSQPQKVTLQATISTRNLIDL